MSSDELPQATERRRAAQRLLERALLLFLLLALTRQVRGIGPARARALLGHRERHGPPRDLQDLLAVPGIGPTSLEALRNAREVTVLCQGCVVAGPGAAGDVDSAHERPAPAGR